MPHPLRTVCIIAAGLFAVSGAHAQQMDGWPDWLVEAMEAESRKLKNARMDIEAGPYSFELPKKTTGPNAFDGGWYFESDIGSNTPVECYVMTNDIDLASFTTTMAQLNIDATVEANPGDLATLNLFTLDAGNLGGIPYFAVEWIYTVGEAPSAMVGFSKVLTATNGAITQACSHNTIGYRESFKQVFETFVQSLQQPAPETEPYYEELGLQTLDNQPVGFTFSSYTLDADGDTRIETVTASLFPVGPDALASSDSTDVTWSTPDGLTINSLSASAENGELTTNLQLVRNDIGDWVVAGTFQGKELEEIIDGNIEPLTGVGEMQLARDLMAGDDTSIAYPVWTTDADPTRFLEASITRDDEETAGQVILTLGPLTMNGRLDEIGSLEYGAMQMGASQLIFERVWNRGTPK